MVIYAIRISTWSSSWLRRRGGKLSGPVMTFKTKAGARRSAEILRKHHEKVKGLRISVVSLKKVPPPDDKARFSVFRG